jgi:bacterioferritin-associated ferredoxin
MGTFDALEREMQRAMDDEGWHDIILTGGEPTLSPVFFPLISAARRKGFEMVAVATNGRRFAYAPFAREAQRRGLNRAWVSLFGHTPRIHDACTRTPGSFEQCTEGIRNLLAAGVDVTCSIVVCKVNHRTLPEYFDFVHALGVRDVQMMGIKPFGGAFIHKGAVFYDLAKGAPYVNSGIRYGLARGFTIKTMGFPKAYFDVSGTVDDNNRALKYFDYILKKLGGATYCKGPLCDRCFGRNVCPDSAPPGELVVCKCWGIPERVLREAIRDKGANTVEKLQFHTGAGTGCETCIADLELLLAAEAAGTPFSPNRVLLPGPGRHGKSTTQKSPGQKSAEGGAR